MDDTTIARWRLRSQRLTRPGPGAAGDVVRHLAGVQAENPLQSAWAVATRTADPDAADLAGALASGDVLRTHVLRSTWHYVAREDADWLLAVSAPSLLRITGGQLHGELGFTEVETGRLGDLVLEALDGGAHLSRPEVAALLRERAPDLAERLTGRAVMLLMAHLEMDRRVCSGAPRPAAGGKEPQHTYAAWSARVGARTADADVDREGALADLARRYLAGHGPATAKDLSYWATVTLTEAKRGIAAVADGLASFDHEGRTYWHPADQRPPADDEVADPAGHLLQLLDETYRGYQDSRWVLDPDGLVPRGREAAVGMALVDARLVAWMRRTLTARTARFDLTPFRPLTPPERRAVDAAAERYAGHLGLEPEVRVADG
ncbi:winged helix DNA-binding domain-containing protein [Nocardioides solisilvae]|uniref:winged helix DNA-binding domain-containing protein n=1 Tax=Nocardioides solisilvae TaxID=1542435 RepID=UPI0013A5873C|nr:winged helix DNA-binding domain-containing protein [Nocardioides solisilvae]